MIDKKIHYCWFGGTPLPEDAKKCILSWKKYFPDFEIVEWNEANFDVNGCNYTQEAYKNKKWAFVSDYARFKILYENGGVYFDTDVEVIKSFDQILENGNFMGKEANLGEKTFFINPGLGLAAQKGDEFCKEIVDYYSNLSFDSDNITTVCEHVTHLFDKKGYLGNDQIEKIYGYTIYPEDYFCPKNYYTGSLKITENTYSIHHYSNTWSSLKANRFHEFEIQLMNHFGNSVTNGVLIKLLKNIYCTGLFATLKKSWKMKCKR